MRVLTAVHLASDDALCILHRDLADRLVDVDDKRDERKDDRDGQHEDDPGHDAAGSSCDRIDALLEEVGHAGHDGSEDQHRNAVADSLLRDALAEPHQERGTCRCADRDDRQPQSEQAAFIGNDVHTACGAVGDDDADRLHDREADARIAGDALDLLTAVLFLAHPLESGNRDG